ncbi:MAG: helix-turn-helix domain-containing protein [Cellvibrionaceae bacterium]
MAQIKSLVHTLKKQLKAHGKTYTDVAKALELSEASVKRLFSGHHFTLQRLESISQMIGLQISDLVQLMLQEQPELVQLTEEQEEKIVSDPLLLMITVNVINGLSFDDMINKYSIKATDCIQKLAQLDRLKIIELLPNNRIKLLIAPNFAWLPNGPIQQFYQQQLEREFFQCCFDQDSEKLIVLNGLLTNASNSELQKKMQQLANSFNELIKEDMPHSFDKKYGNTAVFALRQWQYSLFEDYLKK